MREQLYRLSQIHVQKIDDRGSEERKGLAENKFCYDSTQEPAKVSFPTNDNPTSQILSQQCGDGTQNRLSYDEFGYMIPNAKCDYT